MVIKNVSLETVAGPTSVLPDNALPEFAFAGKSNVGKSSMINTLVNRKSLARTSQTPGKTQTINYYNVNGVLYLVDLPGYGYTAAWERDRKAWGRMVERYLHSSRVLQQVFLLIDIRHAPGANDVTMYRWIRSNNFEPVIIATKLDKIRRSQQKSQVSLIRETLGAGEDTIIIPFSARTGQGREEIWQRIGQTDGITSQGTDGPVKTGPAPAVSDSRQHHTK